MLFIASPRSTTISVVEDNGRSVTTLDVGVAPGAGLSAVGGLLAFVGPDARTVGLVDRETGSQRFATYDSEVQSCHLDEHGRLWAVRTTPTGFVVELRPNPKGATSAATSFGDAYNAAGGALIQGFGRDRTLVMTYSGQSEQVFYEASVDGDRLAVRELPVFEDCDVVVRWRTPDVAFGLGHPDRVLRAVDPFVSADASVRWPYSDSDEDERPGLSFCPLDEDCALLSSSEGRIYVLHTPSMQFTRELHVEGFEPVPLAVKYPRLRGETMVSDLVDLARCGDAVCGFFAESPNAASFEMVTLDVELDSPGTGTGTGTERTARGAVL